MHVDRDIDGASIEILVVCGNFHKSALELDCSAIHQRPLAYVPVYLLEWSGWSHWPIRPRLALHARFATLTLRTLLTALALSAHFSLETHFSLRTTLALRALLAALGRGTCFSRGTLLAALALRPLFTALALRKLKLGNLRLDYLPNLLIGWGWRTANHGEKSQLSVPLR